MWIRVRDALLIVAISLLSGCSQSPSTLVETTQKEEPKTPPDANSKAPTVIVINPPRTGIRPTATPTPETPRKLTLYLPDKKGKLHQKVLGEPADLAAKRLSKTESALVLLFRKAPQIIPAGTRLTKPIRKNMNEDNPGGAYWEVSLNGKFQQSRLWKEKKRSELVYDAIVSTVGHGIMEEINPTYPVRVRLLIEGKPIKKLGALDVSEPVPVM